MPNPRHYDAILIGAGGAGLNLLLCMHKQGFLHDKKILIIEPSKNETNNRTWCFWARPEDEIVKTFQGILHHSWDFAKIEGKAKKLDPYRYYHIRGIDFYQFVYHNLSSYTNIHWHHAAANQVETTANGVSVSTSTGEAFHASWVFDSRVAESDLQNAEPMVWQSFFGYRIKTQNQLFDVQALSMMDFDVEQQNQCQFVYVLPFSKNEALVELTRFGTECLEKQKDNAILHNWVVSRYGSYEIVEHEAGRIPMSMKFNPSVAHHPKTQRIIPIGTAAGSVKSTTGYAFYNMFHHTHQIVKALTNNTTLPQAYHNQKFSFYDQLLLIILTQKPHWGEAIFTTLFKKVGVSKILSFLNERTHFADDLEILTSLPKRYFLWALTQKRYSNKR